MLVKTYIYGCFVWSDEDLFVSISIGISIKKSILKEQYFKISHKWRVLTIMKYSPLHIFLYFIVSQTYQVKCFKSKTFYCKLIKQVLKQSKWIIIASIIRNSLASYIISWDYSDFCVILIYVLFLGEKGKVDYY